MSENTTNTTKNELEQASDYLGRHNFKTLVEWFTAEVILNRPKDPLCFLRDLICDRIDQRNGAPYSPADSIQYAKECYQEASETADEEGQIHPRDIPRKPSTLTGLVEIKKRLATLEQAIKSSRIIAQQLDPFEATNVIISETCELLGCDRASLFVTCEDTNELELMVAKGAQSIRLPIGQGVAGTVAATGKVSNIPDAYSDARFNSSHDEHTGYKTKTILASAVIDGEGKTVGVIQAINKLAGVRTEAEIGLENYDEKQNEVGSVIPFSHVDEEMIGILAAQAGIALHNTRLYQDTIASQEKIQSLLDIIKAMNSNLGMNSLMFTITDRAHSLVEADRCTMFLLDAVAKELVSLQGEVNLRIPMDKGIAGECCTSNKVINIPDAYEDSRFNQEIDKQSGYRTKSILCMPCRGPDGTVVGVIQIINKKNGPFNDDDINIMDTFLVLAGPALAQSHLFNHHGSKSSSKDVTKYDETVPSLSRGGSKKVLQHEMAIAEDEEEDDDEDDENNE